MSPEIANSLAVIVTIGLAIIIQVIYWFQEAQDPEQNARDLFKHRNPDDISTEKKYQVFHFRKNGRWEPFSLTSEEGTKWNIFCSRLMIERPEDPDPDIYDYLEFLDLLHKQYLNEVKKKLNES